MEVKLTISLDKNDAPSLFLWRDILSKEFSLVHRSTYPGERSCDIFTVFAPTGVLLHISSFELLILIVSWFCLFPFVFLLNFAKNFFFFMTANPWPMN